MKEQYVFKRERAMGYIQKLGKNNFDSRKALVEG